MSETRRCKSLNAFLAEEQTSRRYRALAARVSFKSAASNR
jgi:hypothetical protein